MLKSHVMRHLHAADHENTQAKGVISNQLKMEGTLQCFQTYSEAFWCTLKVKENREIIVHKITGTQNNSAQKE